MGVEKTILVDGTGEKPQQGQMVWIEYTGWLKDTTQPDNKGAKFDASEYGEDFSTQIGVGMLIKGWDEAVLDMNVGEKAILDITSDYAYGQRGFHGHIPPNADLIL
ncbi:peptidyl-prolyl cis-trans isomerase fkr-3 [Lasiosphaeria miniovina]|uniref:peptidylprolyl isomerase n=1 Tax=Lasiosphaeria miniovina TaxID=1954250 RepID=A0AA40ALL2_9PEZI|nr:peptidyl-prolyl cis-trans isomerase fkr-3 [Lasiosphaeria miniovina]KAK0718120.1 peptidyl-prolyl cis-trans isomerase fkr-3 [Lasiosphaeria miniovina]